MIGSTGNSRILGELPGERMRKEEEEEDMEEYIEVWDIVVLDLTGCSQCVVNIFVMMNIYIALFLGLIAGCSCYATIVN